VVCGFVLVFGCFWLCVDFGNFGFLLIRFAVTWCCLFVGWVYWCTGVWFGLVYLGIVVISCGLMWLWLVVLCLSTFSFTCVGFGFGLVIVLRCIFALTCGFVFICLFVW